MGGEVTIECMASLTWGPLPRTPVSATGPDRPPGLWPWLGEIDSPRHQSVALPAGIGLAERTHTSGYFSLKARIRSRCAASSREYTPWASAWTSPMSAAFERMYEGPFDE